MIGKGLFIVIEGMDGAGKSTQIQEIKSYLHSKNLPSYFTREPGGTSIGEEIRTIILNKDNEEMTSLTEAFLYAASRAQHVSQKIKPMLEEGYIVVCDRFVYSSIAYQGFGRGLGSLVKDINSYAVQGIEPDLIIYLDIPSGLSKERIGTKDLDRIEREKLDFYDRVRDGYLDEASKSDKFLVIDATKAIETITGEILENIDSLLSKC